MDENTLNELRALATHLSNLSLGMHRYTRKDLEERLSRLSLDLFDLIEKVEED